MAIPFLSRMIPGEAGIPTVGEAGRWERNSAEELANLAKVTDAEQASLADLAQGVPSVWGYARSFHQAWRDREHKQHAESVMLWRGFVTLVALRAQWLGEPLTLKPITLPAASADGAGEPQQTYGFTAAAALQWPHDIFGTEPGKPVAIAAVLHEGQSIGLLVPGLMALPSRGMIAALARSEALQRLAQDAGLRLDGGRRLQRNPAGLIEPRLRGLEGFLRNALNVLAGWRDSGLTSLVTALTEFHEEVLDILPPSRAAPWIATREATEWNWAPHSAIRLFGFAAATEGGSTGVRRRAEIQVRKDLSGGQATPRFFLVADHITDPDYRSLAVSDTILVNDLIDGKVTPEIRQKLANADREILVVGERELLEPTLVRFASETRYAGHDGDLQRFLLPVTPLAVAIFGPQQLLDRLTVHNANSDEVKITLEITLETPERLDVELHKTYSVSAGTLIEARAPDAFAIWPDFLTASSSAPEHAMPTLVYQNRRDRRRGVPAGDLPELGATLLLSTTTLAAGVAALSGHRGTAPRLDIAAGQGGVKEMLPDHEILHNSGRAELIQCSTNNHVGVLLVQKPNKRGAAGINDAADCTIAIDFGTSSTTLAFLLGGKPVSNDLEAHVWLPFHEAEIQQKAGTPEDLKLSASYLAVLYNFIPPVAKLSQPFLTILEVRTEKPAATVEPMLRGRIPFPRETGVSKLWELITQPPRGTVVETNLKWTENTDRNDHVRHFLTEVMMLALGHARGLGVPPNRVRWRLSSPLLMKPSVREKFESDAKACFQALTGRTAGKNDIEFPYESDAIFSYVIEEELYESFAEITVILDVGGRSTDVAIGNDRERATHGSIDLAGRSLLVNFWVERWADFCDLVGRVRPGLLTGAEAATNEPDQRRTLIELILSEMEGTPGGLAGGKGTGQEHPLLEVTRLRVQFGFLGLMYFMVHHVMAPLLEANVLDSGKGVRCFLCGNGSKLFSSFCQHPDQAHTFFNGLVKGWLMSVGFRQPDFESKLSRKAKLEVAIGSLYWNPPQTAVPRYTPHSTAAHQFADRGVSLEDPRSARTPAPGTIEHFLASVETVFATRLPGLYRPDVLPSTRTGVDAAMKLLERKPAFRGFGPPADQPASDTRRRFVLELEALLEGWSRLET